MRSKPPDTLEELKAIAGCGKIAAVVFDFDGVILESVSIKTEAFVDLFADYPQHHAAIVEYHLTHVGISRYKKFDWIYANLLRMPLGDAERERLGTLFADLVSRKLALCPFVPGALELLQGLHGKQPTFVASGTPQHELTALVESRGLRPYFREVFGVPLSKPEIIHDILERYNLSPESVLFVGDGKTDWEAAVGTNVIFVARNTAEQAAFWQCVAVPRVETLLELAFLV